jgi:hypothetical protein
MLTCREAASSWEPAPGGGLRATPRRGAAAARRRQRRAQRARARAGAAPASAAPPRRRSAARACAAPPPPRPRRAPAPCRAAPARGATPGGAPGSDSEQRRRQECALLCARTASLTRGCAAPRGACFPSPTARRGCVQRLRCGGAAAACRRAAREAPREVTPQAHNARPSGESERGESRRLCAAAWGDAEAALRTCWRPGASFGAGGRAAAPATQQGARRRGGSEVSTRTKGGLQFGEIPRGVKGCCSAAHKKNVLLHGAGA